ncbi:MULTISPECIES: hypothetical protein [Actinomadura]|uniref:Alkaline shock response membrane anchor protein AmaP n=1 Tax=Actinomadura litoris TaxID=2678616 RepID=A0A7K1KYI4_9ACTN|nr:MULTISPECIES: hypothetical protein [Actinomadura]MBT2209156.1 hypothetical protein [Actinomadura sp. NEAU-AAG7]MUN37035.1 hypothetical protein [Actinomadura litoris]
MRVALAVTGALLFGCGAAALAAGLGGFDGLGALSGRPPLDPALVRFAGSASWFPGVLAAVAELVSLAGQLWLVLQGRALLRRWWPDMDAGTRVLSRSAAANLARDGEALPGVRDLRVRLTGTLTHPRLVVTVTCEGDAVLGEVFGELGAGPVERYRRTMGMPDLDAVIRLRPAFPKRHRRTPAAEAA